MARLIESEGRWIRALLILSTLTVALVLAGLVAYAVFYFSEVLLVIVMAWVFAFLLSPVVNLLGRAIPRLPRTGVAVLVYALLFVALSGIVLLVAAQLAESMSGFLDDLPQLRERLPEMLAQWQATLDSLGLEVDLVASANTFLADLNSVIGAVIKPVSDVAAASLGAIGNLLFMVVLSLFIVIDRDQMLAFVNRITPPRFAGEMRLFQTSVAASFGGFVRGQAIQGLVYGAIAAAGSLLLDIPYAPLTTALVAILQMIPFFGPFFSWAPPVVASLLAGPPGSTLPIFIIMAAGWFVVMNIVQPRVMGSTVGIHPVVVLVSVLIGLRLQGPIGAIFAIPVAAVMSAFFFHYLNRAQGGPRDVTSRAARRVAEREGRRVRVPAPPSLPAPGLAAPGSAGMATATRSPSGGEAPPPGQPRPADASRDAGG
jgi:predicted PurR-regulated permease PerM